MLSAKNAAYSSYVQPEAETVTPSALGVPATPAFVAVPDGAEGSPEIRAVNIGSRALEMPSPEGAASDTSPELTGARETKGEESIRPNLLRPAYVQPEFLQSLEQMRREVLEDAENEAGGEYEWLAPSIKGAALAATTGLLAAVLRAGSLLAMAVSSLPFWRSADPLMVLSLSDEERRDLEENLRRAGSGEQDLDAVLSGRAENGQEPEDEDSDPRDA